jgi:hypothetical protein
LQLERSSTTRRRSRGSSDADRTGWLRCLLTNGPSTYTEGAAARSQAARGPAQGQRRPTARGRPASDARASPRAAARPAGGSRMARRELRANDLARKQLMPNRVEHEVLQNLIRDVLFGGLRRPVDADHLSALPDVRWPSSGLVGNGGSKWAGYADRSTSRQARRADSVAQQVIVSC